MAAIVYVSLATGHCIYGQCTNTKVQGAGLDLVQLRDFEAAWPGLFSPISSPENSAANANASDECPLSGVSGHGAYLSQCPLMTQSRHSLVPVIRSRAEPKNPSARKGIPSEDDPG
jgi:hypothetical protein